MKKLFLTFLIALTASSGMLAADPPGLGPFSIAPDKQIYFAPGNLQYQPSTDTWRFAPNQYDVIGDNNLSLYPTYDGWIDLFTWGSGNNPIGLAQTTASGNYVDWGVNVIDDYPAYTWRAITKDEMQYLLFLRQNANALWVTATVCDVTGIILMPDDFVHYSHTGVGMWNTTRASFTDNVLSAGEWARWEAAGSVFLPSTGYLNPDPEYSLVDEGTGGYYWTSTLCSADAQSAYEFSWSTGGTDHLGTHAVFSARRDIAHSVRLVYGAPESECEHQNILLTEDFGGNEPSDPAICATPYPNLAASYTQSYANMGSGKAMITKRGWVNPFSTTWSDQCDHTFEGDYQRGYFMEVDGLGDGAPVVSYPLQITPPCMLHCECYVANVDAYSRGGSFAFAQLALEVVDRATGRQLGLRDSGPLPQGSYMSTPWIKLSLDLDIQVAGRDVEFRILNTATSMDGNDFAIDDISVWECVPELPVECSFSDTLFLDDFSGNNTADPQIATSRNANIGTAYRQVFSESDLTCGYENNFQKTYLLTKVGKHAAGWHLQDDHTFAADTTRGYFLLVDDGPCAGEPIYTSPAVSVNPGDLINYSAWFSNIKTWYGSASQNGLTIPSFTLDLKDARTGLVLDSYSTGEIPYDSSQPLESDYRNPAPWIRGGAEFTVPAQTSSIKLVITPTRTSNRWGNDYAIDDISIIRCIEGSVLEGCDSVEYTSADGASEVFYADTTFVDGNGSQVTIKVHNSVHTSRTLQGEEEVVYKGVTYTESTTLLERGTTEFGCESVDTVHIEVTPIQEEYLDSLIVNEMDWIICCNNRRLRAHYPADTYEYQWYKDGQPVRSYYPDYHDYYTEDRRLTGSFHLIVKAGTDVNGTISYKRVRSNTITIAAPSRVSVAPNPAAQGEAIRISAEGEFRYRLVSLSGLCLTSGSAEQEALLPVLPQGIYLVEIVQENEVSTLKLMVR